MDSTFLRIITVLNKINFCKVSTLYDIPKWHFSKWHSKSFGVIPSVPIIIGSINVSLSYILAISNRSLE